MKRILPFFLLLSFLFNNAGYLIMLKIRQYAVKSDVVKMRETERSSRKTSLIYFNPEKYSKIHWLEENEFKFEGVLYDVVSKSICEEGDIVFECFIDKEESILYEHIKDYVDDHIVPAAQSGKSMKKILKEILKEYTGVEVQCFKDQSFTHFKVAHEIKYYDFLRSPLFFPIPCPPPEKNLAHHC